MYSKGGVGLKPDLQRRNSPHRQLFDI